MIPAGSTAALAPRQRRREWLGPLAFVEGPVVAPDGMVVGDRAPGLNQRVGDRLLDLTPLFDLASTPGRCEDGEVRSRTVWIDMGEPAVDAAGAADTPDGLRGDGADALVEGGKALPRDGCLECLGEDAHRDQQVADVGGAQEGPPPGPDGIPARALASRRDGAAVLGADLKRPVHGLLDGMVRRLEAEHQQRMRSVTGHRQAGLAGIEQPAVRGVEAGLRDRPDARGARQEVGESGHPPRRGGPDGAEPAPRPV